MNNSDFYSASVNVHLVSHMQIYFHKKKRIKHPYSDSYFARVNVPVREPPISTFLMLLCVFTLAICVAISLGQSTVYIFVMSRYSTCQSTV